MARLLIEALTVLTFNYFFIKYICHYFSFSLSYLIGVVAIMNIIYVMLEIIKKTDFIHWNSFEKTLNVGFGHIASLRISYKIKQISCVWAKNLFFYL